MRYAHGEIIEITRVCVGFGPSVHEYFVVSPDEPEPMLDTRYDTPYMVYAHPAGLWAYLLDAPPLGPALHGALADWGFCVPWEVWPPEPELTAAATSNIERRRDTRESRRPRTSPGQRA